MLPHTWVVSPPNLPAPQRDVLADCMYRVQEPLEEVSQLRQSDSSWWEGHLDLNPGKQNTAGPQNSEQTRTWGSSDMPPIFFPA